MAFRQITILVILMLELVLFFSIPNSVMSLFTSSFEYRSPSPKIEGGRNERTKSFCSPSRLTQFPSYSNHTRVRYDEQYRTNTIHNREDRRYWLRQSLAVVSAAMMIIPPFSPDPAGAVPSGKSRSDGYAVRHTGTEWTSLLSGPQLNVLRRGGTERQRSSILDENEGRRGAYFCAGCRTPLFASNAKFTSGTGWPSFDSTIDGGNVEVESDVGPFQSAEVRCGTCGGHLGDVFNDGWRFKTNKTGKRYCINGAALLFKPESGENEVRGDIPPPNKLLQYEPALYKS